MTVSLSQETTSHQSSPTMATTTTTTTLPQRYNGPAKDGDWVNYRDTITSLYLDQNKSLKEVMRIMREEYYFFATEKMYKIRFNKWGLHKKLRAHQVAELLVQRGKRAAVGKTSVSFVHGRKIDSDRLNTYLRRVSPARRKELEAILAGGPEVSGAQKQRSIEDIICRTPSPEPEDSSPSSSSSSPPLPMPRRLDAPDGLRLPEECMQIVHSYVSGAFDGLLWQTTPDSRELVFPRRGKTWLDPVSSARQLFVNGFMDQGFHMLKITFDDYGDVMSRQDPSLLVETCLALGALAQSGPGLAESLLNYAFSLSRIVFGPRHPLHLLFARLKCANPKDITKFVGLIMQSYVQALLRNSQLKPTYLATLYRAMLNSDFIGVETAQRCMQELLDDLEMMSSSPSSTSSPPDSIGGDSSGGSIIDDESTDVDDLKKDVEMLRYHVSWLENLHNNPTEAAAAARTLAETRGSGKKDPRVARFSCYNMLRTLRTSHAVGTDEAIEMLYRSLDICEEEFGRVDNATVTLLATLQSYLRRAGYTTEADAIRADFEARWDEVVDSLGKRMGC